MPVKSKSIHLEFYAVGKLLYFSLASFVFRISAGQNFTQETQDCDARANLGKSDTCNTWFINYETKAMSLPTPSLTSDAHWTMCQSWALFRILIRKLNTSQIFWIRTVWCSFGELHEATFAHRNHFGLAFWLEWSVIKGTICSPQTRLCVLQQLGKYWPRNNGPKVPWTIHNDTKLQ